MQYTSVRPLPKCKRNLNAFWLSFWGTPLIVKTNLIPASDRFREAASRKPDKETACERSSKRFPRHDRIDHRNYKLPRDTRNQAIHFLIHYWVNIPRETRDFAFSEGSGFEIFVWLQSEKLVGHPLNRFSTRAE